MKNKIQDLNKHLFLAIENLHNADSEADLKKEIQRSKSIAEIGKVLVESAKTEVEFVKACSKGGKDVITTGFFGQDQKQLTS